VYGVYRFTHNPMYLGLIVVLIGLPVYAASLGGFLASLILIPVILNRINMEELVEAEYCERYP
jgi:protein-S-isoprenylcysteine O-methyltransferase Ste14